MKKIINILFIGIIVLFLLSGLVFTLFFPDDINYLENRSANKVEKLTLENYLDGDFQKKFGDALNDQVPLQGRMKKMYNYLNAAYEKIIISEAIGKNTEQRYISIKDSLLFGNNLVYYPRDLETMKPDLDKKIENIEAKVKEDQDINFYVYYIEKDTDINFETNEKVGAYEYLSEKFKENNIPIAGFEINSFKDFEEKFYKTDHHWNCYGSYQGYSEVMKLLNTKDELIKPEKEMVLEKYKLSGSKAAAIGATGIFTEKFPVYQFQYPKMDIRIDGEEAEDYGQQKNI